MLSHHVSRPLVKPVPLYQLTSTIELLGSTGSKTVTTCNTGFTGMHFLCFRCVRSTGSTSVSGDETWIECRSLAVRFRCRLRPCGLAQPRASPESSWETRPREEAGGRAHSVRAASRSFVLRSGLTGASILHAGRGRPALLGTTGSRKAFGKHQSLRGLRQLSHQEGPVVSAPCRSCIARKSQG